MERLWNFLSPHLKRKKMKAATRDPLQSELGPSTPRSRLLGLSTWAICNSTKAGGKKTWKSGRAHSTSRAAVVWWRTWWSCFSLKAVNPLFSLKGRDNSLVYHSASVFMLHETSKNSIKLIPKTIGNDNISTLNSSPSALTGDKSSDKSAGYASAFNTLRLFPS